MKNLSKIKSYGLIHPPAPAGSLSVHLSVIYFYLFSGCFSITGLFLLLFLFAVVLLFYGYIITCFCDDTVTYI